MPAESQSLFKIVLFLGVVFLMASLMTTPWVYVGQPIPPNSTWGRIQQQTSNFPVLNSPNNAGALQRLYVSGDFWPTNSSLNVGGWKTVNNLGPSRVGACVNATAPIHRNYFGCLSTLDSDGSYVKISTNASANPSVTANVSSPTGGTNILVYSITAVIQCHQEFGTVLPLNVTLNIVNPTPAPGTGFFSDTLEPQNPGTVCPTTGWSMVTYTWDLSGFKNNVIGNYSKLAIRVQAMDPGQTVDVSYAEVDFTPTNQAICATDISGVVCELGNLAWGLINFFVLIGSGIVFVFQVLFWFVGTVGTFFMAIPNLFGFGAPPLISAIIGLLIIGLLFYVAFVLMGKIRGTGNTG